VLHARQLFSYNIAGTQAVFAWWLNDNAETVQIRGLNSDWQNSVIMTRKKDGTFTADVTLPKDSKHEFKYLVNEKEWLNEPQADSEEPNEFGGINSVLVL